MTRSVRPTVSVLIVALAMMLRVSAVAHQHRVLYVSDVEMLYAAVNNPAYADGIVVLAPGVYTLTTKDANNENRPNGGGLLLQSGMTLVGQNRYVDSDSDGVWDPRDDNNDGFPDTDPMRGLIYADPASETIIDAFNLPGGAGPIHIGLDNRIERLTVRNTNQTTAAINANVVPASGGIRVEIRDCLLEDGQRGIRLATPQIGGDGLDSSAVIERNILRRHVGAFGFGLQIIHVGPSTNSSWDVFLRNNLIYSNRVGLFLVGENSSNVQSDVLSMRNMYRQNELGLSIQAGRDGGSDNTVHFTSIDDGILDNVGASEPAGFGGSGGVVAMAGFITPQGLLSTNDALDLRFLGTRWFGNFQGTQRQDLQVYGCLSLGSVPGINDTTRVLIRNGASHRAAGAFRFIDSLPVDTTGTDKVTIIGSNMAFTHSPGNSN